MVEGVVLHAGGTLQCSPSVHADNRNSTVSNLPPPPQRIRATLDSFPDRLIRASLSLQGDHQLDNLSTALGIIDTLLSSKPISEFLANADPDLVEMIKTLDLPSRLTPETIERGIQDVKWPGRLSFYLSHIPLHPVDNPTTTSSLLILADGAHNPASAHTLGAYISHLQFTTSAAGTPTTYILALSHSPPKTPHDTLAPILAPVVSSSLSSSSSSLNSESAPPNLKPGIALLPFTPPASMPWVRSVDPRVLRETVVQLFSDAPPLEGEASLDITNKAEIRIFDNDTSVVNTSELTEGYSRPLVDAVRWAAARHQATENLQSPRGLVVLAGSLYLVADLYQLLEGGFGSGS